MKDDWQGNHRRHSTRAEPRRYRDYGRQSGPFRDRGRDEERWGRRDDEEREDAWVADALRHSSRGRGDFHGGGSRYLARRIADLGSFDPYENVPPFRSRSGQEDWRAVGRTAARRAASAAKDRAVTNDRTRGSPRTSTIG
ncbi:hypothetical protein N181_21955 [Sinorhizobium fredii USDA 205]|uniref:hypothetical protein n=1 Tax=Rhizobium fredii TaxID=380 RepID=UPI00072BE476|nr:hypothetical protein [Sinorhizobium fredii]ASY71497.1 hypothetical protein SF83666_b48480 [Sinorhizobium fredii CCBAU 83666]KSV86299.1 hypothetical protein N181_21955 [Sinorhizobium fredii USDA 205]GEC32610.1 hypothetical protein EFR01_27810 [Sinorhizobium fredii]GLS08182.1 hypothetical protein GCM10007864_18110 [Sinorhizobium fredii]